MLNLRLLLIISICILLFLIFAKNYCKEKEKEFFGIIRKLYGTQDGTGLLPVSVIDPRPVTDCVNNCKHFYYTNVSANPNVVDKLYINCLTNCNCDANRVGECAKNNSEIQNMHNKTRNQEKNISNMLKCLSETMPNKITDDGKYQHECSIYTSEDQCNRNKPHSSGGMNWTIPDYKCRWITFKKGPNKGKTKCVYPRLGNCADGIYGGRSNPYYAVE